MRHEHRTGSVIGKLRNCHSPVGGLGNPPRLRPAGGPAGANRAIRSCREVALAASGLTLAMSAPWAAKQLQPPIEELLNERNVVAILEVQRHEDDGRVRFRSREKLWNEAEGRVSLIIPDTTLRESLQPGESYLIAYSYRRQHPLFRKPTEDNPDGPYVVEVPVAGLAVFENSAPLRYLFSALSDGEPNPSDVLNALLVQMQRSDARSRRLSVFEFAMRMDLYVSITHKQFETFQDIVEGRTLTPHLQEFLIRATQSFPERYRGGWVVDLCRDTIRNAGTEYDLASGVPLLVRSCAGILENARDPDDMALLAGLLYSNSPGVAKLAFAALHEWDPGRAGHAARAAVKGDRYVHPETQRVLMAYLRRDGPPPR